MKKERNRRLTVIGMIAIQKYRLDPVSSTRKKNDCMFREFGLQSMIRSDNNLKMG